MSKDLPIYKITIDPEYSDGEDLGIEQIAFTSTPAIKVKGMAFNQAQSFFFADATKYRIVAPAMIPMEIYRRDDESGEYYVQFTEEVIEQIYTKFMRDLNNRNLFNLEHETERTVPAYILESWIVEKPKEDKAYTSYGIEVPKGTLMLTAQVTDVDYYEKLVKDEQIGFSIEGFLGLKLSNQIKLNTMKLPDGEHLIEGKFYTIEGGEVIEVKEQEMAETQVEEEVKEEVAMAEDVVEEELEEISTSAGAGAYLTAKAFRGNIKQNIAKMKNVATQLGYTLSHRGEEELKSRADTMEQLQKENLAEAKMRYHEYKKDESATPHQKIAKAISEVNKNLQEVERMIKMNARLQSESGIASEALYRRTQQGLLKLEARLIHLAGKVRDIRGK